MTIDIIIPNFNGAHLIKNNLPSVWAALKDYSGKIIIIDDGSRKEDVDALEKIISQYRDKMYIELVKHSVNKGFSSAVNSGVGISKADYVVLLNSDVVPSIDFLESPLKALFSNTNLFGVGCMDKSIEKIGTVLRGRGLGRWSKGFLMHSKGDVNGGTDTFWISGGSCIIRRDLYKHLGGFDEIYNPFYWEDIDLSYRAQKAGYSILFDMKSVVTHYHDEGSIKENYQHEAITTTSYRNQFIFVWKNITSIKLLLNHFLYLPVYLVRALVRKDAPFLKGFFLAMMLLPAIIKKRLLQKKLIKFSDERVIGSIA